MAREVAPNKVSVLPPTHGIKDQATRAFADAMINILDARSGYTNKNAPERFITAAEFQGLANQALVRAFGGAGAGSWLGNDGGDGDDIPSAADVHAAIDNLAEWMTKQIIYQKLGEQFGLIDIESLRQGLESAQAGIKNVEEIRTNGDMALASAINTIWAAMGGSSAVIQDGKLASASPNSAEATKWSQVQAAVRDPNTGNTASASILQETRAYASNADGKFNAIYSVRAQVDVGGRTVVGGFGLAATNGAASGQGPTINFGVRADTFFIAATSSTPDANTQIAQGSSIPFMVLTSSQVVNGVVYPPGVYIKKAVIGDATIGNAQIANAAITTAKIQDAQITTAKIKDLAVDTLKIAGEAVTVPRSATASNMIFLSVAGSTQILSLPTIDVQTSAVAVFASVLVAPGAFGDSSPIVVTISLYRNGVKIASSVSGLYDNSPVTILAVDYPGGPATYSLTAEHAAFVSNPGRVSARTLVAIGCKR